MFKTKSVKWVSLILTVILVLFTATPTFASNGLWARFVIGQSSYTVNGQSKAMDAAPYISETGRTLVPVRYLADALGAKTTWDETTRRVTVTKDSTTIVMFIGSRTLTVNDKMQTMDVAPVIKDGRTYLPARYVAEALGAKVEWDAAMKMVTVTIGDATPPPIQPPVQPAVSGQIDMTAAKNGTLQRPAGAVAPPNEWGFPAKAVKMEFKVGSRYANVTWADGSKSQLDLGTPCVIAAGEAGINFLKEKYPQVYNGANCIVLPNANYGAFYVPFIPVAEAFGVPAQNIVWDGQHLAVFGYYGNVANYRVLTPGTRDCVEKTVGNNQEVGTGKLDFPLFVKDGVPMVGIDSVSDVAGMLFSVAGGSVPGLVNAYDDIYFKGWDYESGVAQAGCEPRT